MYVSVVLHAAMTVLSLYFAPGRCPGDSEKSAKAKHREEANSTFQVVLSEEELVQLSKCEGVRYIYLVSFLPSQSHFLKGIANAT